jgi:hypothetical protein
VILYKNLEKLFILIIYNSTILNLTYILKQELLYLIHKQECIPFKGKNLFMTFSYIVF